MPRPDFLLGYVVKLGETEDVIWRVNGFWKDFLGRHGCCFALLISLVLIHMSVGLDYIPVDASMDLQQTEAKNTKKKEKRNTVGRGQ